jgi:outer membrane lipoprotein-sorting protein
MRLFGIILIFGIVNFIYMQDTAARGLEIANKADELDKGFKDNTVELVMILKNQHGQESTRYMRSKTLEVSDDGDKSMIIFDKPADVKGTATLTYTHKTGSDDQWLYLPSIKRVKRISSSNKSGPFMGSEFAFEDLASQEVEKYMYKFVKEDQANNEICYVVERYPLDENSGYTKHIVWYNKENYRIEKTEFYDRKSTLLKTLTFKKFKKYSDKYWRAQEMYMENHQTGKSTELSFNNYKFNNGFDDTDFNSNSLKRVR